MYLVPHPWIQLTVDRVVLEYILIFKNLRLSGPMLLKPYCSKVNCNLAFCR